MNLIVHIIISTLNHISNKINVFTIFLIKKLIKTNEKIHYTTIKNHILKDCLWIQDLCQLVINIVYNTMKHWILWLSAFKSYLTNWQNYIILMYHVFKLEIFIVLELNLMSHHKYIQNIHITQFQFIHLLTLLFKL